MKKSTVIGIAAAVLCVALTVMIAALALCFVNEGDSFDGLQSTNAANTSEQGSGGVTPTDPTELDPASIVYPDEELPSLYITTENKFQVTSKTEYTECTVRLVNNERYSEYESVYTTETGGKAQIRCRGNMSYRLEDMKAKNKYSYKIKLDEKADFLGMGRSRHWVLINSWRDPGYQRNKTAYDYSAMFGLVYVETNWVSVYYNGEYRGLYLLGETIRVDEDRIEMFSWEEFAEDIAEAYADEHGFDDAKTKALRDAMEEDLSWITTYKYTFYYHATSTEIDLSPYYDKEDLDFTSGYLIESCQGAIGSETVNWHTEHNVPISVDAPSRLTNPEMLEYVKTFIQDFEDAIMSPTFFNSKGKHYSEYVDIDSMVDYWLVWNYFLNSEFSVRSVFFYIENGQIVWGPCWDFDGASGSIMTMSPSKAGADYWLHDRNNAWWLKAFSDPWFTSKVQERWYELRELNDMFLQMNDIYFDYIAEDAQKGYEYDGVRYIKVNNPGANNGHSFTPAEDHEYIMKWLPARNNWLDENFAKLDPNIDNSGNTRSTKILATLSQNGKTLSADRITVYGINADYLLPTGSDSTLSLKVSTSHSAVTHIEAYLNGSTKLGQVNVASGATGVFEIDPSMLDRSEGALNVIYLRALRPDGSVRSISSVYIRVSDTNNPTKDECVVEFGDMKFVVAKGSVITVPDYPYDREGFVQCGWTDDDVSKTLYKPGDTITVNKSMSFYIRFKPTDMCSQFRIDEVIPR